MVVHQKPVAWSLGAMAVVLGASAVPFSGAAATAVAAVLPRGSPVRSLPDKLLIGYGSNCDKVRQAVEDGVNVVIWSFLDIVATAAGAAQCRESQMEQQAAMTATAKGGHRDEEQCGVAGTAEIRTSLDLESIRHLIRSLDKSGYEDTIHLASFGGWNGPHLDPNLTPEEWYHTFKEQLGDMFHGVDWDLEGHDNYDSPTNFFTIECLNKMGTISQLLKRGTVHCDCNCVPGACQNLTSIWFLSFHFVDGYTVGMAPPQSYLDLHGDGRFSRRVNLKEPARAWHPEFSYFGRNVYAYLLAKFGDSIDFVSIQFYESYSKAGMALHEEHITAADYLQRFVESAAEGGCLSAVIDFAEDEEVGLSKKTIQLPLSKLVFGFANGWADDGNDKTLYFAPEQVQKAWKALDSKGQLPRGFMFWTINEEGISNGIYYARELSQILHNR